MQTINMTPGILQDYVNWGWLRSGYTVYKCLMEKTCCSQYSIRLDVNKFVLSRSQRRVLKVMATYLRGSAGKKSVEAFKDESLLVSLQNRIRTTDKKCDVKNNTQRPPGGQKKAARRDRAVAKHGSDVLAAVTNELERRSKIAKERSLEDRIADGEEGERRLKICLVRACPPSLEYQKTMAVEHALFAKYEMAVHQKPFPTFSEFDNCMASTPLSDAVQMNASNGLQPGFGSYHQQYWIDDRLVAVGVIDILPQCLSAKYMFYDPDLSHLSLGIYTALREIAFVKELARQRPELHYYNMGAYVQDCPKTTYKGGFRPAELLCERTLQWVPLPECRKAINANGGKFTVFRPNEPLAKRPTCDQINVFYQGDPIRYGLIPLKSPFYVEKPETRSDLEHYVKAVGSSRSDVALTIPRLSFAVLMALLGGDESKISFGVSQGQRRV